MTNLIFAFFFFVTLDCFFFDLNAKDYKCFTEELPTNFDVFGEYDVKPGFSQNVDFRVQDPRGKNLVSRQNVNGVGEFSFIARDGGDYQFCFYNRLSPSVPYHYGLSRQVKFNLLTGTETRDYENVAKREHLKPVEINLRMMEDIVKEVYSEYSYLKKRDVRASSTSQTIHDRVFYTALISLLIIIVFGTWQVWYMRRFFQQRKIV